MSNTKLLQTLADQLDEKFSAADLKPMGGSSLNETACITGKKHTYFLKTNVANRVATMEAERDGLKALEEARAVRVPQVFCAGSAGDISYLVLEFLEMGHANYDSHARFGRDLARLHECTADAYGWYSDNYIGLSPQHNQRSTDWADFYCRQRLGVQLDLLERRSGTEKIVGSGRKLKERLSDYFRHQTIPAALLHGDLWAGNWGALADGTPVMFDPAVYYGDPESDIAMTRLFGGFNENFYAAYREFHPDSDTGPYRRDLYRLYHLLNHCNLFGTGYYSQALQCLEALLHRQI